MLSSEEYRAIFDASPDGCVIVDRWGAIRAANPRAEALFGWSAEELVGQNVDILVPEAVRETHGGHRSRFASDPHNRPMGVGLELHACRRDGSTFPVEISLSPWSTSDDDSDLRIICTIRDVTDYRRLQNFSEGALRATEEERQRIARELHDDTAQRLATLILRLRRLVEEPDRETRLDLMEEIRDEIVDTTDAVRRMARGLRPPELEEVGLALAIVAHVRSLLEGAGCEVRTELEPVEDVLGLTAKLALYRIVQEALSNARKHADCRGAKVRLFRDGNAVVAEVSDQGDGFRMSEVVERSAGLGLVGMQERATMIGARLTIDSEPGRGTRVRVTVPIERNEDA